VSAALPPTQTTIAAWTAAALSRKWLEAGGWRRIAAALLLLSHPTSFALAFPHFSTYFNFITGTPYKALPYVRETNTDWGQDVARLGAWVRNNGVQRMNLALYGLNAPGSMRCNHTTGSIPN